MRVKECDSNYLSSLLSGGYAARLIACCCTAAHVEWLRFLDSIPFPKNSEAIDAAECQKEGKAVPRPYSMAKRENAKDRTRRQIGRALIRVLVSQPYDATTITGIAREASVSTRTVQRHFGSKDRVLAAALRYPGEALAEELSSRPAAESAEEAIGQLVEAMFAVYNSHRREMWAAYSRAGDVPELAEAVRLAVAGWMAAIEDFFSCWPDVWAIDRQMAKRALITFTSYPTWRGVTASGGFGSPEAERFVTDVLCRYLLREGRRSQKQS